ncbi:MAG: hypothetical protein ABI650_03605 [Dokdonella sp.]
MFAGIAATVIGANALVVAHYAQWSGSAVPEWPVAVDLLILLPLIHPWLYRRAGRRAIAGALLVLSVGIMVGSLIVPSDSKQLWPWLEQSRWLVLVGVLIVQGTLLLLMAREVCRTRVGLNLETAVHAAVQRRFGQQPISGLLKMEARMWLYALLRDPLRQPLPGDVHFSSHAQNGNASNQQGFLILLGAEISLLHLLLHFLLSPTVALVVSAVSVYGWIFLLAEYRARQLRPISLDLQRRALLIRSGIAVDLRIPLADVFSAELSSGPTRRQAGQLRIYGMGEAKVRLRLQPGSKIQTVLGERETFELMLGVDRPKDLVQAVNEQLSC